MSETEGRAAPDAGDDLERLVQVLPRYTYRVGTELALQQDIGVVLAQEGFVHEREHVPAPGDRFDFWVSGRIVIEVKVDGSLSQALGQVRRYARHAKVQAVVLAASRHWAGGQALEIGGKPVRVVRLKGALF